MRKTITTAVYLFFGLTVIAQKGIDGMIQAERDFAAYSVAHTTKEAFLEYIDSNSIMFDNGAVVKAIDFWNKREKKPGVLNWRPQFAEISASGDFGFTTGPWTYQSTINDTVAARGQFATVWHLTKEGKWKFLADLGVDNTPVNSSERTIKITAEKHSGTSKAIPHVYPLVSTENDFQRLYKRAGTKAYGQYLSKESILTRNGAGPAINAADQKSIIDSTPKGEYKMEGWGVSPVEDMGYTYGSITINGKKECYLRMWRLESGGWKIAIEVLRY